MKNLKINIFKNNKDIQFNTNNNSNILLVTGLSGSGKSYLSNKLAQQSGASIFQPEWLIHYKHVSAEFKPLLDEFINKYSDIKPLVDSKWNNEKSEDNNQLLKKYINLLLQYFLQHTNPNEKYIIEGLQLFTLIDFDLIKDYPVVIKGTSSVNSLKNRIKRDYQKRKTLSFGKKIKWFNKVLAQSRLYQFKHRKVLNKFIKNYAKQKES